METLEIVIGLIFIFLLLSLFATTVQELLSSLIALRGKILLKAVTQLLEVDTAEGVGRAANSELAKAFKEEGQRLQGLSEIQRQVYGSQTIAFPT